jgi:Flp pilus assembly pilin Flp
MSRPTTSRPASSEPPPPADERGQATAEYALVLLGAAAIALLLLAWATQTDAIGRLLDAILDSILERV